MFHDDWLSHSSNNNVITSKIRQSSVLVLRMGFIKYAIEVASGGLMYI
jgi:hypothetical protein